MSKQPTNSELSKGLWVYAKDPTTGVVSKVAVTADMQVGTVGSPKDLQVLGGTSLSTTTYAVTPTTLTSSVSLANADTLTNIYVSSGSIVSGLVVVTPPPKPKLGQLHFLHDSSATASKFALQFTPPTPTLVDGQPSLSITKNMGTLGVFWNGSSWSSHVPVERTPVTSSVYMDIEVQRAPGVGNQSNPTTYPAFPNWNFTVNNFALLTTPTISSYKITLASAIKAGDVIDINCRVAHQVDTGTVMNLYVAITDGSSQIICPGTFINWGGSNSFFIMPMVDMYTMTNDMAAGQCVVAIYGYVTSGTGNAILKSGGSLNVKLKRKMNVVTS